MTAIALSFLWRRARPLVTVALRHPGGMVVMAIWLTQPPDMFTAVLMLVAVGYAAGAPHGRAARATVGARRSASW